MVAIKDTNGVTRHTVSISEKAVHKTELMKENYILLSFSTANVIPFQKGDFIDIEQGRFEIVKMQFPSENADTGGYDYELRFDSEEAKWTNRILFYDRQGGKEKAWSLTRQPQYFLDIVVSNLQTAFSKTYTYAISADVENSPKLLSFDSRSIFDGLTDIATAWETEWYRDGNIIHFGECKFGSEVVFDSSNVTEMSRQGADKENYATRLYPFGSTRNIPTNYRPTEEGAVVEGVIEKRLMLPIGTDHVDAYPNLRPEDVVEAVVAFEDVYPKRVGTVSAVTTKEYTDTIENEDGTTTMQTWLAYRIADTGLNFSDDYILPGEELKIVLQSGSLNGLEFAVRFNPDVKPETLSDGSPNPEAQILEIIRNEDYGTHLPNDVLKPIVTDTYILSGYDISLVSDSLIPDAEQELLRVATDYLAKHGIDPSTYTCPMRSIRCAGYVNGEHSESNELDFSVGQRVKLLNDTYFDSAGRSSRILGFEKRLDNVFEATYTVGEFGSDSRLNSIEDKIQELTYRGKTFTGTGVGDSVYLVTRYDKTTPSDTNAYSSLRANAEFISKNRRDVAEEEIVFKKGLKSGGNLQSENFASGLTGGGYRIDPKGNAQMQSLILQKFLEVPELRYNKITIVGDEQWITSGGLIESVTAASTLPLRYGNRQLTHGGLPLRLNVGAGWIVKFKLEDGDTHTFQYDDILISKFKTDTGFQTGYYRVTRILSEQHVFITALNDSAPQEQMSVARQGNFTNKERQNSIYLSGRDGYMRVLSGVDSIEIDVARNIRAQYGNLNGLVVDGESLSGYGMYGDNVYLTGALRIGSGKKAEDAIDEAEERAKEVAEEAKGRMDGWVADGVISPLEKTGLKAERLRELKAVATINSEAGRYELNPGSLNTKWSAFNTQIERVTAVTPENIAVGTLQDTQSAYYTAKEALINEISTKVKEDTATAKDKAEEAKGRMDGWVADGVISPLEKTGLKAERLRELKAVAT